MTTAFATLWHLREWLDDDEYVAVLITLGLKPTIDL